VKFEKIQNVYLLGIGGIGMSALARYFKATGKKVMGYDKTRTALTDELMAEKIDVYFDENTDRLLSLELEPDSTLVIYTPAVPKTHAEYLFFIANHFSLKKRSEVLGMITENGFTIAVAGTHGKTTTSALITHILCSAGVDCSAFLGGITQNYHTNLILGKKLGEKDSIIVVEADQYDRSFLALHPDIAVVTSIDADHLDIYGDKEHMQESYHLFAKQVKKGGFLIAKNGTEKIQEGIEAKIITYSLLDDSDINAADISISKGNYHYAVITEETILDGLTLGLPGSHNVENSVAAIAVARLVGVTDAKIKIALASFKGVKRRFEYQIKSDQLVFIDDYAHHPEELRACITSVRELYPDRKLTGVFQPHLFTRTRDFADGFAESLSLLDEVILLDIYPAREQPIEGVTSGMLLDKITIESKMLCTKQELVSELKKRELEVLLTVGAGDIDMLVEPIKKALMKN
jgi:UDP-N-acetylmuramate--alanine ligase